MVCCLFKRVGEADELRLTELTSKEFDPHWQPLFRESYGDDNARESRTWTQSCDLPTQLFLPNLCRGPQNGGMDQCVEVMCSASATCMPWRARRCTTATVSRYRGSFRDFAFTLCRRRCSITGCRRGGGRTMGLLRNTGPNLVHQRLCSPIQ